MPQQPRLYSLIYRSQASPLVQEIALTALLRNARLHNERNRIGGLLLYANGEFMQVLEGPESALTELYDRIQADPRHFDVRMIAYGPIDGRSFPDWRMAYAPIDARTLREIVGFLPLKTMPGLTAHPTPEMAQTLRDFVEGVAQDQ